MSATQPTVALNRKITGVFDNDVESPPGSPQDAVRKKPQVSSESDGIYLLFATPLNFPLPHLSCLCTLDSSVKEEIYSAPFHTSVVFVRP